MRPYNRILPPPLSDFTGVMNVLTQVEGCFALLHSPHGCAEFFDEDLTAFALFDGSVANIDLDQDTVTFGAEDRVIEAIEAVEEEYAPEVIALVATPVSAIIGTDLAGIARQIQDRTRATLVAFDSGGILGDWWQGESAVFSFFAREMAGTDEGAPRGANLLGASYSLFNWRSDLAEIRRLLDGLGVPVTASYSIGGALDGIRGSGGAGASLVLARSGAEAAEALEERFGVPALHGLPMGFRGTREWLGRVGDAFGADPAGLIAREEARYRKPFLRISDVEHDFIASRYEAARAALMGPAYYTTALARFLAEEVGLEVATVVLTNEPDEACAADLARLPASSLLVEPSEDEVVGHVRDRRPHVALGDSYFRRLVGERIPFVPTVNPFLPAVGFYDDAPYLGFRGALYLVQEIINALNRERYTYLEKRRFPVSVHR